MLHIYNMTKSAVVSMSHANAKEFAPFGLPWAGKPVGFAAAQLSYSWMQLRDEFKDWNEKRGHP